MRDWSSRIRDALRPPLDVLGRSVDASALLDVFVGPRTRQQAALYVALPALLWSVSLAGYGMDAFAVGGGCLVVYPATAALLGVVAAFALGVADRGLALAAVTTHGGAFGYLSVSAARDYAGWGLAAQLRVLLRPDAHAFLGVLSIVIALWPFVAGSLVGHVGRRITWT